MIEHQWHERIPGEFLGVSGDNRRISSRMLHVGKFKDRRMARENVQLDEASIIAQLTAPASEAVVD